MTFFIEYDMPVDRSKRDDLKELERRLHTAGDSADNRKYLADASISCCQTGDTYVVSLLGEYAKSAICFTVTSRTWKDVMLAARWLLCENFKVDESELPF